MTEKRGFTLIELLVAIAIIGILLAILLPTVERARHKAYIAACGANLHAIGQALAVYADANHGQYPRTLYVPGAPLVQGTGATSPDPFGAGTGVAANDTTAPLWLLARVEHLPTKALICPYGDENESTPDTADPQKTSNFSKWRKTLGYSYANPYPGDVATLAGYRLTSRLPADFAVVADLNPGISPKTDPTAVRPGMVMSQMERGNSFNHEWEGQNVLYADGHVSYQLTPFCGHAGDNIYTCQSNTIESSPVGPGDSVLLPDEDDQ
jgi:prepilin-type N-terminal cleavage/methylation domain-containing protein/prepilin-type processing-associated H-X9-DG protein